MTRDELRTPSTHTWLSPEWSEDMLLRCARAECDFVRMVERFVADPDPAAADWLVGELRKQVSLMIEVKATRRMALKVRKLT